MNSTGIVLERPNLNADSTETYHNNQQQTLVGQDMRDFVSELKQCGYNILKLLEDVSFDPKVYDLLKVYIHEFSSQTNRVAVIGQMKAGKSSFINAFTRRSDLLPSDVNPWTTVVTQLHFGAASHGAESADFNFFAEDDWRKLAEGGGKLRELVERFLPGFESDRLSTQVSEMRERAIQRHGDGFYEMLGQGHSYDTVTPDIIRQYVCAGELWNDDSEAANIGRYSDITEAANIYLNSFPFAFPTTLIDTPGTNDPFFVRDEITCQNLESADIFVVVLHAQQALTMSDLGMLRILQGLNKDRVVLFINRVDQLNNPEQDVAAIEKHVRYILQNEFPSVNFPIVFGSAKWGLQGSETGDAAMMQYSGVDEVGACISRMMLKGKGRNSVAKVVSNLNLILDAVQAVVVNQQSHEGVSLSAEEREMQGIQERLGVLKELSSKAAYYYRLYENQLEELIRAILDGFRDQLNSLILEFAEEEIQRLFQALENRRGDKVWHCDTLKIRRALEDEFLRVCRDSSGRINAAQDIIAKALRQLTAKASPGIDLSFIQFYDVQEGEPYLSTLALNHTLAMDLDSSWWKQWWSKDRKKREEWAEELQSLIKRDFFPMAERLVQSAKSELSESARDSMNNFSAMNNAVVNIIEQEILRLTELSSEVMENRRVSSPGSVGEHSSGQNLEHIAFAEEISKTLQKIHRQIHLMTSAHSEGL